MPDMKLDMKLTDQIVGHKNARHEIAGHENTGHEFARHDKYRMLHINIVGVITYSDNSTRRLVMCIIGYFFNSLHYTHYTVPLLQRQHHNTRKKL